MMSQISWKTYLTLVTSCGLIYYAVIVLTCYRDELKLWLSGRRKGPTDISERSDDGERMAKEEQAFQELEQVVADLKHSMNGMAGTGAGKEELLMQLGQRLANYDGLRRPAFHDAVNHFIVEYAHETCGVVFSEEELVAAWKTVPR